MVRLPVWTCTDATLGWKLNSHLRPCSSRACACALVFILHIVWVDRRSYFISKAKKMEIMMRSDNRKQEKMNSGKKKIECMSYYWSVLWALIRSPFVSSDRLFELRCPLQPETRCGLISDSRFDLRWLRGNRGHCETKSVPKMTMR